ncbi:MAG: hypothetical protein LC725_01890, partial [Lentisphaerae bacterium]|nr:hypothetical protein [Lentisphaerota bacterium]
MAHTRLPLSMMVLCVSAVTAAMAGTFELRINDVSGLDEPWPLIAGLPFSEGELHDAAQIRLVDAAGHEVPAQIDVAATWRDGTIRWALAGFTGSPQDAYRVEFGGDASRSAPENPLVVQKGADGELTIDTGVAVYAFLPDRLLPDAARMGDTPILANAGDGAYLVDNQGRLARVAGERAEIETEILKQGPLRLVIRREGWYVTGDGERVARARMWFYFAAGSPYLRMTHSLVLTEDTNDLWVRDYGLEFNTPESPREVTFALGESDEVFSPRGTSVELDPVVLPFKDDPLYMYQDTYPHFMETDYRAVVGRVPQRSDARPIQSEQDEQGVFWTNYWIAANDVAGDWGDAQYARHGLTLVTPYLAQRFPKEIAFDQD